MLKFINLIIATSLLTSCSSKEAPFQSLSDGLCSESQRSLVSDHISSLYRAATASRSLSVIALGKLTNTIAL